MILLVKLQGRETMIATILVLNRKLAVFVKKSNATKSTFESINKRRATLTDSISNMS